MSKEFKLFLGMITVIGGAGYIGYLHNKVNKLSEMIDVAVDEVSSNIQVTISDDMLETAVQRAINREVSYISDRVSRDLRSEIHTQVKDSVDMASSKIKESVGREITDKVRHIDISDMQREVISQAKDAIAEKFDTKLEGLLDEFNDNLQNVQKIYSSIAKSMSKE